MDPSPNPKKPWFINGWFKSHSNTISVKTVNPPLEVTPVKHLSFRAPSPRKLTISSLQLHGSNTKYSCHHPITLTNGDRCLHCKINKWLMEVHHSV